ncbi:MAG: cobalamin-dependent protein [bacterium]
MSKRVLFITPPYHCGVVESGGKWQNLGFLYIAEELRKEGHQVEVYDAMAKGHTYQDIEEKIEEVKPDIVGSNAYTATLQAATRILQIAKSIDPNITTIIGGIHPTMMPEETLQKAEGAIDFVIRWEGEYTTPELLKALEGKMNLSEVRGIAYLDGDELVLTAQQEYIQDLDSLSPAWDLVDWEDYYVCYFPHERVAMVSSSRGCSFECTFCSQQKFWQRNWRARSPENFVGEIETLHRKYGVTAFSIIDEYPTKDRERWEGILDLLVEKDLGVHFLLETRAQDILRDRDILYKYRKAGIIHMFIGLEATSQDALDTLKKSETCEEGREAIQLLNEQNIITEGSFIVGFPDETEESIHNTLKLSRYYNVDHVIFLLVTPWPYSDIYENLSPYIEDFDYSNYNLVEPIVKPKSMSREELMDRVVKCYKSFYMRKLFQWLTVKDELKKKMLFRGFKAVMENSFLKKHMPKMGRMSEKAKKFLYMLGDLG